MELRTTREGVANLRTYLRTSGIFSLNNNPWLPSLDDIGCRWEDMVDLVNNRELFFCKLYRKRSVYLTPEVYFLLKSCFCRPPLTPEAGAIYSFLQSGPAEKPAAKQALFLSPKAFDRGFAFLLENLYVTSFMGRPLVSSPANSWFTLVYTTVEAWEDGLQAIPDTPDDPAQAEARLRDLLSPQLDDREVDRLLHKRPAEAGKQD